MAHRAATAGRWSSVRVAPSSPSSASSVSTASPTIPVPTGSKRPIAAGLSSICTIGLYGAIPVWLAKDAPITISRSASFISQLATGVPLRPSTPAPSG